MSRPHLLVCTRCEGGDELFERIKEQRRRRELKDVFKAESVRCLDLCDRPCTLQIEGKKRSTVARVLLTPNDADAIVEMMLAFASLDAGEELGERQMPGEHAD